MIYAALRHIETYLPAQVLDNEMLAAAFESWTADKIREKTGVLERHVAGPDECVSDMAVAAGEKLLTAGVVDRSEIDFILLCTQSPDYFLPTTACLVQHRLGIPTHCGALDFNLGCSGFVYGLGLAKGLIETGQARNVLLLTAETYTKYLHPQDKSVRTLFGDAAAATLVQAQDRPDPCISALVFGTDGAGGGNLIVPTGGCRRAREAEAEETVDESGNVRTVNDLYMNGGEIFMFTLQAVPRLVKAILAKADLTLDQVDHVVLHQANKYILDHLRKKLGVAESKFHIAFEHCGNTVSSTIPIALKQLMEDGRIRSGERTLIVGFGVGYSWAGGLIII